VLLLDLLTAREEADEAPPIQLDSHAYSSETADENLDDHAPRTRIEIGEQIM
jgi:hypothetical protein